MSVGLFLEKNFLGKHFPALTHKDFRRFWCGQCISLIGTWMQTMGQSWLVYKLTNSSFLLGIIGMLQFLPLVLFSLPVGAVIDRYSKKKILFCIQLLLMTNAFVLSILVWSGYAAYWNIAIVAFVLGILNSIDMPVRQSFVVELASKEHLMNAISLNSTIFNAARIIGPAVAGIVFGAFGAAACFLINGISFIPVLIGIWLIKVDGKGTSKGKINFKKEIGEGIKYIFKNPLIYTVMLMVSCINMIIINSNVTIPVLTTTVLNGDSKVYGYLMTAMGIGAFLGAFILAATSYKGVRIKRHFSAVIALGLLVCIMGFQSNYYIICGLLLVTGFCQTTALSSSNSTIQLNSPDNMRGRIMSAYALINGLSITVGNVYAGTMCERLGVSTAYKLNGIIGCVIVLALLGVNYRAIIKSVNKNKASMVAV